MSVNNTIMLKILFFLIVNYELKNDVILYYDVILKQTRCICVSISSLFGDKTENNVLL